MTTKNENAKHETTGNDGAAAQGAGAKTDGARSESQRIPMPWEIPMFGPDAFARGQEAFARGQQVFAQMMQEQIARTQKVMDELAGYEAVAVQRARTAVVDLAKLATDSLDYCAKLSAEWRKVAVDTGRRAADHAAPRA